MSKYIIELEKLEGTNLWRAKGCNTLVFDENGIKNILTPYKECAEERVFVYELEIGDAIRTEQGKTLYRFRGFSNGRTRINAINIANGQYVCLPCDKKYWRVKESE